MYHFQHDLMSDKVSIDLQIIIFHFFIFLSVSNYLYEKYIKKLLSIYK
jgi:hypothetical protein